MFGVVLTCAETRTRDAVLTQVMANKFMHFDTLPKHGPTNSEEYGAVLPVFIKDFENRCQDCWKKSIFSILAILFSVDVNKLPANFQMECIELQSDIQCKEKFDHVSSLDFNKTALTSEKYPSLHNHALLMSLLTVSMYCCFQE